MYTCGLGAVILDHIIFLHLVHLGVQAQRYLPKFGSSLAFKYNKLPLTSSLVYISSFTTARHSLCYLGAAFKIPVLAFHGVGLFLFDLCWRFLEGSAAHAVLLHISENAV